MINTLFLTLQLSNLLLLLSFSTRKHTYKASRVILSNCSVNSKPPTISIGIVACTFSDNHSRNSCIFKGIIKPGGSLLRLERKQKNSSNPFRIRIFLFFSYSFGIEAINTFILSLSFLENYIRFQTKYPFSDQNGTKNRPDGAAHSYIDIQLL